MRRSETWGIALRAACISALLILAAGYTLYRFDAIAGTLTLPKDWVDGEVITAAKLDANPVAIAAVINGGIDDANLTNAGITGSTKLKNLTVTLGKMAADSVDSSKLVNGSVALADLQDGSVSFAKLETLVRAGAWIEGNTQTPGGTLSTATWTTLASSAFTTNVDSKRVMLWCVVTTTTGASTDTWDVRFVYDCGGGDTTFTLGGPFTKTENSSSVSDVTTYIGLSNSAEYSTGTSCTFKCQGMETTGTASVVPGKVNFYVTEWTN